MIRTSPSLEFPERTPLMSDAEYMKLLYAYYKQLPAEYEVEEAKRAAQDPSIPKKTTAEVMQALAALESRLADSAR